MEQSRFVLVLVLMLTVLVLLAAAVGWAAHQRVKALREHAARQGWSYARRDKAQTRREGTPFGTGRARSAEHVLAGPAGDRRFTTFEYRCTTGDQRNSTTHRFVVTVLHLSSALPRLQVCEENLFSRLAGKLGTADISLESEQFNRRFRVTADDRRFAYGVLTPSTMQRLLAQDDVALRVQGAEVLSWTGGTLRPEDVGVRVQQLAAFADAVPDHVWSDHTASDRFWSGSS